MLKVNECLEDAEKFNRAILYKNAAHERDTYRQFKNEYKDCIGFEEKYKNLIRNLDEESKAAVDKVLRRMEILFSNEEDEIDLYEEAEKKEWMDLEDEFYNQIHQLEKNKYTCNGIVLSRNYFDPLIFRYHYSIDWFQGQDLLRSGNVLDIGAFIGDSAIFFTRMTTGEVYSWEAMKGNYDEIRANLAANDIPTDRLHIVPCAVGMESGLAMMAENETLNWSTMKPYASRKYKPQEVSVQSIDDFVYNTGIRASLIKLHVEGAEYDAIRGAEHTLKNQKPMLIISIYHTPTDFWSIKPYLESLDLGYRFKIFKPLNGNIMGGLTLLAEAR